MAKDAFKQKIKVEETIQQGTPIGADVPQEPAEKGLLCMHGIHSGEMPIRGKTVAEARAMLAPLWNIDPAAVAVVAGEVVPEDAKIGLDWELLTFVKQAAVKGSPESLLISGKQVVVKDQDGDDVKTVDLGKLVNGINVNTVKGLTQNALPPHTRWLIEAGINTIVICELTPALRRLRVARTGYGDTANYEDMRLATPYVVIKAVFQNGHPVDRAELFYRNAPLRNLDDVLLRSNMLNVSVNAHGCFDWVCTQYLQKMTKNFPKNQTLTDWMDALVKHLWDSGLNRSSEAHEGESAFSFCEKNLKDDRATDFDKWQNMSIADPKFVLGVKWFDHGLTVRKLLDKELEILRSTRPLAQASDLVSTLN